MESVLGRKATCESISATLASGNFNKTDVLTMMNELRNLVRDTSWEVRAQLQGRSATTVTQTADRQLSSAQQALSWAESHAPYVLLIELIRYVGLASTLTLNVLNALNTQVEGLTA
jgi:hypothetical protein